MRVCKMDACLFKGERMSHAFAAEFRELAESLIEHPEIDE